MVGGETVSGIAIGVGCRKGCPADTIEALVRRALDSGSGVMPLGIFTIADKRGEVGLSEAAERLGLTLNFVSRDDLQSREGDVRTRSDAAQQAFSVASVAEAAALVGAGPNSILIVPRIAADGATCAIAEAVP